MTILVSSFIRDPVRCLFRAAGVFHALHVTQPTWSSGGASAVKEPGHFEVRKSSSQVTRMHSFSTKKVDFFDLAPRGVAPRLTYSCLFLAVTSNVSCPIVFKVSFLSLSSHVTISNLVRSVTVSVCNEERYDPRPSFLVCTVQCAQGCS